MLAGGCFLFYRSRPQSKKALCRGLIIPSSARQLMACTMNLVSGRSGDRPLRDAYLGGLLIYPDTSIIEPKNPAYKKNPERMLRILCVGVDLSFQSVARQVLSALVSLTSVFGMGTGGPSPSETPTMRGKLFGFLLFPAQETFNPQANPFGFARSVESLSLFSACALKTKQREEARLCACIM